MKLVYIAKGWLDLLILPLFESIYMIHFWEVFQLVWVGGKENGEKPLVAFVAVIDGDTDVEELVSKVSQFKNLIENSDTKPDPDSESKPNK